MTGRGIDQILPHPSNPAIHESYAGSALEYVALAENVHGAIPRPAGFSYIWGDALEELERFAPDLRIINLETSITTSSEWEPKGINYRMHPSNVPSLTAAKIDCCALANNHVLDWGCEGLMETLATLQSARLTPAGAGQDLREASRPAIFPAGDARLLVFAMATPDSGVPPDWAATETNPGVLLAPELSAGAAQAFAREVHAIRRPGDAVVVSIHWGGNWGYEIPPAHREFAYALIDAGAADVIHGHSSHHPKAMEVYKGRLILYGCGDFINDYEGIPGYEEYRSDLVLMYFVTLSAGELAGVKMAPLQIRRFRLQRISGGDADWLSRRLDGEARPSGARVVPAGEDTFELRWK